MTQPSVAAEVHQPLDIHRHLAPQVALDYVVAIDDFANLQHFLIGQLRYPAGLRDADFLHDFIGLFRPDAMDILQCNNNPFVGRYIDAGDAGHSHSLLLPAPNRAAGAHASRGPFTNDNATPSPFRRGPVSFDLSTWMRVINGFNVVSSTSGRGCFCAGQACGQRFCGGSIWPPPLLRACQVWRPAPSLHGRQPPVPWFAPSSSPPSEARDRWCLTPAEWAPCHRPSAARSGAGNKSSA